MSILIVVAYAFGWLLAAAFAMRILADQWGCCHYGAGYTYRHICITYHGRECWRPDGEITLRIAAAGCGVALACPLLLAPGVAYWFATRKPTPLGQALRIEKLERQMEIL